MKKQWIGILIVGMTYGTAWAVRGQFGHEQGAAWAGGIGALALVLVSKRNSCMLQEDLSSDLNYKKSMLWFAGILVIIILLTLVSSKMHGEMSGSHNRYQV